MNEYWDTSHDAELMADRIERLTVVLERLIELGEKVVNCSKGTGS